MTPNASKHSTLSGDLIVLFSGQYGFHRDELDVLMNVHQLDCACCPRSDKGSWWCWPA